MRFWAKNNQVPVHILSWTIPRRHCHAYYQTSFHAMPSVPFCPPHVFLSCSRCLSSYLACGSTWFFVVMLLSFLCPASLSIYLLSNSLPLLGSWYKVVGSHELALNWSCVISLKHKKKALSLLLSLAFPS